MKRARKLVSALLVILIIFSVFNVGTFAQEAEIPDGTTEPVEEIIEPTDEDIFDVTMYLCATANSFTGHVWLYFINNGTSAVDIGYLQLEPGQGMSVGNLSYTRVDGGGTYYNGEARMATKSNALEKVGRHTTSLSMSLTPEQLETVNNKIKSKNFYSIIFDNCGVFASLIWNSVSNKKVIHIVLPVITVLNMSLLGAKKGELIMQSVDADEVYKQRRGTVEPATDNNFNVSAVTF